jgi:hypothetical protein
MLFNATFDNVSYIVAVTFIGGGKYELTTLEAIGTDCIGSCKSNCHTITTMTQK